MAEGKRGYVTGEVQAIRLHRNESDRDATYSRTQRTFSQFSPYLGAFTSTLVVAEQKRYLLLTKLNAGFPIANV